MRLWHIDLIPYLPDSQLAAQWRELNSIFKNKPSHILINYVYPYPKIYLRTYADTVLREIQRRGFTIQSAANYKAFFEGAVNPDKPYFFKEHDDGYLIECFFNLAEKYQRGQKDFDQNRFRKLCDFMTEQIPTLKDLITLVKKRGSYANGKCMDDPE